jgi:hypothetical protein
MKDEEREGARVTNHAPNKNKTTAELPQQRRRIERNTLYTALIPPTTLTTPFSCGNVCASALRNSPEITIRPEPRDYLKVLIIVDHLWKNLITL